MKDNWKDSLYVHNQDSEFSNISLTYFKRWNNTILLDDIREVVFF